MEGLYVRNKTRLNQWPFPELFMSASVSIADSLLRRAFGWKARPLDESRSSESLRGFSVRQDSLEGRTAHTKCGLYLLGTSRLRMPVSQHDCAISPRTVVNNAG